MKIAVWKTGHIIADTVAEAVYEGLKRSDIDACVKSTDSINDIEAYDCHLAYGILRGTSEVFKQAAAKGKFWFNFDRGYFKPSHFDGYYRVSLNGTQQTVGLDKLEPDYDRLDALGVEILPPKTSGKCLVYCPPTEPVKQFFEINTHPMKSDDKIRIRDKSTLRPLQSDLDNASGVITFNSSVGWEALRQGIRVISDPTHSMVGTYQKLIDKPLNVDYEQRRRLFALMASLQLTLAQMKQGLLWPLLQRLLNLSKFT